MAKGFIRIGGAREHNLKNLTLEIPRDKLVVITGLSGSGKSSLAFDTIYAEGQRKYVESLSAYARQFLDQLQKPDVDYIEGLSPTVAIEQRSAGSNPRSIIATTTEIYDYLRLLYAHVGQPHCPETGQPITAQTTSQIVDAILALPPRTRLMLLAPVVRAQKGEFRDVLERLAREGFIRARVDGELVELTSNVPVRLDPKARHTIEVVVDRLVIDDKVRVRLSDSVELALRWGEGRLVVLYQLPQGPSQPDKPAASAPPPGRSLTSPARASPDGSAPSTSAPASSTQTQALKASAMGPGVWYEQFYSNRLFSPATGKTYEPLTPKHFSFNAPAGACPVCHGLGQKMVFDESLIVPDPTKSLEQGAILPWRRGGKRMVSYYKAMLRAVAAHYGVSLETPYRDLPDWFKRILMHGSGDTPIQFQFWRAGKLSTVERPFEGVIPNLERLYAETESEFTRARLKAFMNPTFCDACGGKRLKPEVLAVTLQGRAPTSKPGLPPGLAGSSSNASEPAQGHDTPKPKPNIPGLSIMDVCALSIDAADQFFATLQLSEFQQTIAADILKEIRARLGFLKTWDWATSRWTAKAARSAAARPSASAWPPKSAPAWWACSTSWTSRASACTSATTRACCARWRACATWATRSSSSSTTRRPSAAPTGSLTLARARACAAASRRGRPAGPGAG
jgi:excinuclease ABC subunit A